MGWNLWEEFQSIEGIFNSRPTSYQGVEGFVIYTDASNQGYGAMLV